MYSIRHYVLGRFASRLALGADRENFICISDRLYHRSRGKLQTEIDCLSDPALTIAAEQRDLPECGCTPLLPEADFQRIVRTMALDAFKWDTQVGDDCNIAPFAIVLSRRVWTQLASCAEAMTSELFAVERELQCSPEGRARLGMPPRIRKVLAGGGDWSPSATRIIRYDFHPTARGWQVSEANSDVPGGYTESTSLPQLMQEIFPQYQVAGSPADRLVESLQAHAREHRTIGLIAAPGYIEDQQIVAFVAAQLRKRAIRPVICRPEQIEWTTDGRAVVRVDVGCIEVDVLFRFFQAEWLAALPEQQWSRFFVGGKTPVCNPGSAILTESKRLWALLPLLRTATPTLRALTPRSVTPRVRNLAQAQRWVFKLAYSNNGDAVFSHRSRTRGHRIAALRAVLHPRHWVAQEEFEAVPLDTPCGEMYPCFGVYTIDGKAGGIYGRISSEPIIDYRAKDVAVLIRG